MNEAGTMEGDALPGPSGSHDSPKGVPVADAVRLLIPLGTATVVGVFVALGIEGDARERLIRNQPGDVVMAFALVLVGLTLPVLLERFRNWLPPIIGGALVLGGALVALDAGSRSISDREQPDLKITTAPVKGQPGNVDVVVTGKAISLASKEKMLLRVIAVRPTASGLLFDLCRSSAVPGHELESLEPARRASAGPDPVRTLHWGESAPSAKGETSASASFRLPSLQFSHVCAYAALTSRTTNSADHAAQPTNRRTNSGNPAADQVTDRFAVDIIDLRSAG